MTLSDGHFLKQIHAEPENQTHRLVYADWLEEQGDPLCALVRRVGKLHELNYAVEDVLTDTDIELLEEMADGDRDNFREMPGNAWFALLGACACRIIFGASPMRDLETRSFHELAELMRDAVTNGVDEERFNRLTEEVTALLRVVGQKEKYRNQSADVSLLAACLGDFLSIDSAWNAYYRGTWDSYQHTHEPRLMREWLRGMILRHWLALWGFQPDYLCIY